MSGSPWDRQSWESAAAYAKFRLYLEQAPPRSILDAYREHRRRRRGGEGADAITRWPGSWDRAIYARDRADAPIPGGMSWQQRADAFDRDVQRARRDRLVQQLADYDDRLIEVTRQAIERVAAMLDWPIDRTVVGEDGAITVEPARWTLDTAARLLAAADRTARLALGAPTDTVDARGATPAVVVFAPPPVSSDDDLMAAIDHYVALRAAIGPESADSGSAE